jgi:hypothetical protein
VQSTAQISTPGFTMNKIYTTNISKKILLVIVLALIVSLIFLFDISDTTDSNLQDTAETPSVVSTQEDVSEENQIETETSAPTATIATSTPTQKPTSTTTYFKQNSISIEDVLAAKSPTSTLWVEGSLTWNDFLGTPTSQPGNALISQRVNYLYESSSFCENNDTQKECTVTIEGIIAYAEMNTQQSWVRDGYETAHRLNHEQKHFDITEYYARKSQQALNPLIGAEEIRIATTSSEAKNLASEALNQLIINTLEPLDVQRDNMQDTYDDETEHSLNIDIQFQWDAKIAQLLAS